MKGLSAGISIRVGQTVGSGRPEQGKIAAKVGLMMAGEVYQCLLSITQLTQAYSIHDNHDHLVILMCSYTFSVKVVAIIQQ